MAINDNVLRASKFETSFMELQNKMLGSHYLSPEDLYPSFSVLLRFFRKKKSDNVDLINSFTSLKLIS